MHGRVLATGSPAAPACRPAADIRSASCDHRAWSRIRPARRQTASRRRRMPNSRLRRRARTVADEVNAMHESMQHDSEAGPRSYGFSMALAAGCKTAVTRIAMEHVLGDLRVRSATVAHGKRHNDERTNRTGEDPPRSATSTSRYSPATSARLIEEGGKALAAYLKPREEGQVKADARRDVSRGGQDARPGGGILAGRPAARGRTADHASAAPISICGPAPSSG